jgi:hypothetical protein
MKTWVQTGQIAKAQGLILDELAKTFGGAAVASATMKDKLKASMGELSENLGKLVNKVVEPIRAVFLGVTNAASEFFKNVGDERSDFEKTISKMGDVTEAAKGIVGPVNDLTRNQKLSAEQINALVKLYPQLTGVMNANNTTTEQANKLIDDQNRKQAQALIQKEINLQTELGKKRDDDLSYLNKAYHLNQSQIDQLVTLEAVWRKQATTGQNATAAQKAFTDALSKTGISYENVWPIIRDVAKDEADANDKIKASQDRVAKAQKTLYDLSDEGLAAAAKARAEAAKKAQADAASQASSEKLIELLKERTKIERAYAEEKAAIDAKVKTGDMTQADAEAKKLEAHGKEIEDLSKVEVAYKELGASSGDLSQEIVTETKKYKDEKIALDNSTQAVIDSNKAKTDARDAMASNYKSYNDTDEAINKLTKDISDQQKKLDARTVTDSKGLEAEHKLILDQLDAWEAQGHSVEGLRIAVNKLFKDMESSDPKEALKQQLKAWESLASSIENIISSISSIYSSSIKNQISDLDNKYTHEQELLEYDGKTKEEYLQAQVDAAEAGGNAETIAAAKKELALYKLEEEYTKKKAKLQYQSDMVSWEAKCLTAAADAAMAIIKCYSDLGPILGTIAAVSIGAVVGGTEMAAVIAAKPQPPKFQTGSIVLPSNGGSGRQITAGDGGGADILFGTSAMGSPFVDAFAQRVAEKAANLIGPLIVTVPLSLDGKVAAEAIARRFRNGEVRYE